MPRPSSKITQAEIARAIRAAKQAGAAEVEVPAAGGGCILIRITPSTAPNIEVADHGEVVVV